jgi:hypothetical protein
MTTAGQGIGGDLSSPAGEVYLLITLSGAATITGLHRDSSEPATPWQGEFVAARTHSGGTVRLEVWRVRHAIPSSSGTYRMTFSQASTYALVAAWVGFSDISGASPTVVFDENSSSTTISHTIASNTDSLVLAAAATAPSSNSLTASSGQTSVFNTTSTDNTLRCAASWKAGASSVTVGYASSSATQPKIVCALSVPFWPSVTGFRCAGQSSSGPSFTGSSSAPVYTVTNQPPAHTGLCLVVLCANTTVRPTVTLGGSPLPLVPGVDSLSSGVLTQCYYVVNPPGGQNIVASFSAAATSVDFYVIRYAGLTNNTAFGTPVLAQASLVESAIQSVTVDVRRGQQVFAFSQASAGASATRVFTMSPLWTRTQSGAGNSATRPMTAADFPGIGGDITARFRIGSDGSTTRTRVAFAFTLDVEAANVPIVVDVTPVDAVADVTSPSIALALDLSSADAVGDVADPGIGLAVDVVSADAVGDADAVGVNLAVEIAPADVETEASDLAPLLSVTLGHADAVADVVSPRPLVLPAELVSTVDSDLFTSEE